jgi:hypothetical protein
VPERPFHALEFFANVEPVQFFIRLCSLRMEVVPRESREKLFRAQGMKNPTPRLQMLDGFNEGWIDFERGASGSEKGSVPLETVLKALTKREAKSP